MFGANMNKHWANQSLGLVLISKFLSQKTNDDKMAVISYY